MQTVQTPGQMPHDVASDQGLQCFLTGFFPLKIECHRQNRPNTSIMTTEHVLHITKEESNSIQWVKYFEVK